MSNGLFANLGIDLGALVNEHIAPSLLPATLIKVTPGTRTAGQLTGGTNPTTASYACRGMLDRTERKNQAASTSEIGSLRALVGANSIASAQVPQVGDQLVIEGATYRIEAIADRDPAAATYTLTVRPV